VCKNERKLSDHETGLHYNYYRYYDPKIGRYLRADPIGIAGGVNLYAYVLNNPLNYIDPYGLISGGAGSALGNTISFIGGTIVGIGLIASPVSWGTVGVGIVIAAGGQIYNHWGTKSDFEQVPEITRPYVDMLNDQKDYVLQIQEETGECVIKE
jgi:RHS repeat-associated protein